MEIGERVAAIEQDMDNVHDEIHSIHDELHEIKNQNVAIYEIASSLKVLTHDFKLVQEKVSDISDGQQQLSEKLDHEIDRVKGEQESFRKRLEAVDSKGAKFALKFLSNIGEKAAWVVLGSLLAFLLYQVFPFLK